MTAPALDVQTAAEVVATLALRQLDKAEATLHGDVYEVTRCQVLADSTGWPHLVSLTISDDTHGEIINATLHVSSSVVDR